MKAKIIKIGNSKGVRIPKPLLEQTGLEGEVEIEVWDGALIVAPAKGPRSGWGRAFQAMAKHGDDVLLDDHPTASSWDEEWEWQ